MLNHEKLMELYRELRQRKVLSVYLDVDQHDPAERNKWRIRLEHDVKRKRKELNGNDGEGKSFDQAWSLLRERLEDFEAFVPEKGWVGFATPDRLWYAETVPVQMPDGVFWDEGIHVAPYVRGLKHARPVVVVLMDTRRTRLFRYHGGEVMELEDVRADTFMGDLADTNQSKRAGMTTGMRGETATDTAQQALEVTFDHMLKYVVDVATEHVGTHGFLVLAGVTEAVPRLAESFPKHLQSRTLVISSLPLAASEAWVKEEVGAAASLLTRRYQDELLNGVVEAAGGGGRASLGRKETELALDEMRVDTLLLSRSFISAQPELAEACVGKALAQGAAVEELSDEGAARLDREGGGIGARLRYRIRQSGKRPEMQTAGDESDFHI